VKRFHSAHDLVFALTSALSVGRASRPAVQIAGADARATKTATTTVVLALIAVAVLIVALRKQPSSVQETTASKIQSLAVLPLKNLSGDPKQEYFSD
jgi:hypothetical protein